MHEQDIEKLSLLIRYNKLEVDNTMVIVKYHESEFTIAEDIEELVIPDPRNGSVPSGCRIRGIGKKAFFKTQKLTSFKFPQKWNGYIDNEAFAFTNLESIEIPEGTTSIGQKAFFGSKIKTAHIVDCPSIGQSAFAYSDLEEVIFGDPVTETQLVNTPIPEGCFLFCKNLKSVCLLNCTDIYDLAFAGSGIEEITIADNCLGIESSAFQDCPNLKKISVPNLEFLSYTSEKLEDYFAFSSKEPQIGRQIELTIRDTDQVIMLDVK